MPKTIKLKFYSVKMPDGKVYADEGKSIKSVAQQNGVDKKKVSIGVDLLHTPSISQYPQSNV